MTTPARTQNRTSPATARLLAGTAFVASRAGAPLIVAGWVLALLDVEAPVPLVLIMAGVVAILAGVALHLVPRRLAGDTIDVDAPVRGRWVALNSPTTKVPSHGTQGFGQSHAVDLALEPEQEPRRPEFGSGAAMRPPTDYPAFGEPVLAVADAEVVTAVDRWRDHRARSTMAAVALMFAESVVRDFGPPGALVGNHVVLRLPDGSHVLYAHLRRGSLQVRAGQSVRSGEPIAECGNSGNSSEPHLHIQRMDVARPSMATGLPWGIRGVPGGLPKDGEHLDT